MDSKFQFLPITLLAVSVVGLSGCGDGVSAYTRANTICGNAPLRIVQHDGPFANEDWLEVRCKDGSVKAVPNG